MSRTYDAQFLVDLPVLDAHTGSAIATALAAAAAPHKSLAENVAHALGLITAANADLKSVLVTGFAALSEAALKPALQVEATAWAGTEAWLRGLASMPGSPKAPQAQKLHDVLYPDGLRFLRLNAARRWVETQMRIDLIDKDKLAVQFGQLGGSESLAALREAHKQTGVAAGITSAKAAAEAPPVRANLNALKAAFRCYVLQVVANATLKGTDEAAALAAALLAPLESYTAPVAARAVAAAEIPQTP